MEAIMKDVTQIKEILKEHNNLKQVMTKMVCQKYNLEDVDIICVNLQDDVKYGHIFVGTYMKHSNLTSMNHYRFYITLDEYLNFIDKEQDNV